MKPITLALLLLLNFGTTFAQPTGTAAPSPEPSVIEPDTVIDANNFASYKQYLPAAAQSAVQHGLKIRVVPTKRLDWSAGFTEATEKFSPQVGLDKDDVITNYTAGAPFPTVKLSDPKAAVKIAYNWHLGPFMPDDFTIAPWGSFAYEDASGAFNKFVTKEDDNYSCDQLRFLRFAHRTEVEPRPTLGDNPQFEWKVRCNTWTQNRLETIDSGAGLWLRFVDPHRPDEFYNFEPGTRRVRRQMSANVLNQTCRSCHQPYWAYALPKTEEATYRLLGTAAILACLTSDREPAGLISRQEAFAMTEEPFELRSAYVLEMTSKIPGYTNLRTIVYIDTETYVWLAAEFYDQSEETEIAIPLWRSYPSPAGGNLFNLAGEFYVPLRAPSQAGGHAAGYSQAGTAEWFFRTLVPAHGSFDQKINAGDMSERIFNPQAMAQ